ncbi:tail tape measure protein [Phage DSL-LC04]|nr:tail tape measure protein [Phage DSL-LC04]
MEDQGIMALPEAGMRAPTAQPSPQLFDPASAAAFEQMRSQVSPKEFSSEILAAAEQVDPAAVQQLRRALSGVRLPQEIIDGLQQVIEVILRDPQNYAAIRQDLLQDDFPEELLPEQFDPMFFGALKVALDQIEAEAGGQPVQSFAMGGIANLRPIAQAMQGMGRGQDTMLAHITPQEARVLQMMGGMGTVNPATGLREYGLWKEIKKAVTAPIKAVGKAVKSVAGAVKDFAKSSVGKIITTVALGFFLGPAAASFLGVTSAAGVAAVGGFVGGFGSSLLAGESLKDSLKSGAIGGLTAGATAGITGGMNAFEAGSYTGPTTIAGQYDRAVESGKSLLGLSGAPAEASGTLQNVGTGEVVPKIEVPTAPTTAELATAPSDLTIGREAIQAPVSGIGQPVANLAAVQTPVASDAGILSLSPTPAPSYLGMDLSSAQGAVDPFYGMDLSSAQGTLGGPSYAGMDLSSAQGTLGGPSYAGMDLSSAQGTLGGPSYAGMDLSSAQGTLGGPSYAGMDLASAQGAVEGVNPYGRAPSVMGAIEEGRYFDAAKQAFMPASYSNAELVQTPAFQTARNAGATYAEALKTAQDAYNPGMIRTYGPAVAAGVGALGMAGGFSPKQEPPPDNAKRLYGSESGVQLLSQSPEIYGTTPGGANIQYFSPQYMGYGLPTRQYYRPQIVFNEPQYRGTFANGGIASLAKGGSTNFPRKTGAINGPGTATSDSIPAMLSDGEFVFTAKAVRGMGKGSRRLGAKRMYALMKALEGK